MARITVEDCLEKENNRFALVQLAAKRTKQLLSGSRALTDSSNKAVVTALREIADGKVRFMTPEEAEIARQEAAEAKQASQHIPEVTFVPPPPSLDDALVADDEDDEASDDDAEGDELDDEESGDDDSGDDDEEGDDEESDTADNSRNGDNG